MTDTTTATKAFVPTSPWGTQNFVYQLRRTDFALFVRADGTPAILDQQRRNRQPAACLLAFAGEHRKAVVAFLQDQKTWTDDAGTDRCAECMGCVFPEALADGTTVATCLFKPVCPYQPKAAPEADA